jgi:hypothetical protein
VVPVAEKGERALGTPVGKVAVLAALEAHDVLNVPKLARAEVVSGMNGYR